METKLKNFSVYVFVPASEIEVRVQAESLEEAIEKAETNGNRVWAKGITWNDSNGGPLRVIGVLEQGELK